MMMGAGLFFMVVIGLIVIAVPLLIVALIAGGGQKALFKTPPESNDSQTFQDPAGKRKCPTCGRAVEMGWNVCPSCGQALT